VNSVQLEKTVREVGKNLNAQVTGQTDRSQNVTDHQEADLLAGRGAGPLWGDR